MRKLFLSLPLLCGFVSPSRLDGRLLALGLVDVRSMDPTLDVALRWASNHNQLEELVYDGMNTCYLQREAAEKLVQANALLRARRPELRLSLADCLRPRDLQKRLFSLVVGTERRPYVADPERGSMHNYGVAVDVTIVRASGGELDMGTAVHEFSPLSEPKREHRFALAGRLTAEQLENRRLLRGVMLGAGFRGISNEWWHFCAVDPRVARRRYAVVETFEDPEGPRGVVRSH